LFLCGSWRVCVCLRPLSRVLLLTAHASNGYWVWHPRPSTAALAETRQHPLLATQTSTVATKTCLDYLHPHT
jgi:hypothetical protein